MKSTNKVGSILEQKPTEDEGKRNHPQTSTSLNQLLRAIAKIVFLITV